MFKRGNIIFNISLVIIGLLVIGSIIIFNQELGIRLAPSRSVNIESTSNNQNNLLINNDTYYSILESNIVAKVNNDVEYLHRDRLGSNIATTGNDLKRNKNLPFGQEISNDGITYSFTGKELDDNDLYYFVNRYYNPDSGRFLETDSVYSNPSYVYANNNPLLYVDPDGRDIKNILKLMYERSGFKAAVSIVTDPGADLGPNAQIGQPRGVIEYVGPGGGNVVFSSAKAMKNKVRGIVNKLLSSSSRETKEIIEESAVRVGRGNQGAVYRFTGDPDVAIKTFYGSNSDDILNEVIISQRLSEHGIISPIYAASTENKFLVRRYFEGQTVDKAPWRDIISFAYRAEKAAIAEGVILKDLRIPFTHLDPNVLWVPDEGIKILDAGKFRRTSMVGETGGITHQLILSKSETGRKIAKNWLEIMQAWGMNPLGM